MEWRIGGYNSQEKPVVLDIAEASVEKLLAGCIPLLFDAGTVSSEFEEAKSRLPVYDMLVLRGEPSDSARVRVNRSWAKCRRGTCGLKGVEMLPGREYGLVERLPGVCCQLLMKGLRSATGDVGERLSLAVIDPGGV